MPGVYVMVYDVDRAIGIDRSRPVSRCEENSVFANRNSLAMFDREFSQRRRFDRFTLDIHSGLALDCRNDVTDGIGLGDRPGG